MQNRLEALDWLRGLMALSIMLYHFGPWHDSAHPIGRLGVYGVSIFFILSGLSMAIAYDRYVFSDFRTSTNFFIRRLFRIWPLLWLAVGLVVVPTYIWGEDQFGNEPQNITRILLNLTTLAGFDEQYSYINLGAWSIGNEMVYYLFTPILIGAYHWRKSVGNLLTLAAAGVGLLFAFHLLSPSNTLASQFAIYVNPFNNLFLYCSGLAIYFNFRELKIPKNWHWPSLVLVTSMFVFYPASGDQINITTGFNRVAMSAISIAIVIAFYKCAPITPKLVGHWLGQLGIATYGIYLLHPIVIWYVRGAFNMFEQMLELERIRYLPTLISIVLTIFIALQVYKYLETPLISLGKRLTAAKSKNIDKANLEGAK